MGPKPPFGTHTYRFMAYTLDTVLDLNPGATRKKLEKAMEGHILQTGLLEGKFKTQNIIQFISLPARIRQEGFFNLVLVISKYQRKILNTLTNKKIIY